MPANGMMGCPWAAGMMGFGMLLFILVLAAALYAAYRLGRSRSRRTQDGRPSNTTHDEALDVARARYARGDIDREEFERLKRDLA